MPVILHRPDEGMAMALVDFYVSNFGDTEVSDVDPKLYFDQG